MKLLFLSSRNIKENQNGAYRVANRNLTNIIKILGAENVSIYSIKKKNRFSSLFNLCFFKRIEEINIVDEKKIINMVRKKNFDVIFFDTSNYGYLAKKLKKINPNLKIIIFCHDITIQLYKSILRLEGDNVLDKLRALKNKFLLKVAFENEKYSFENSDKIITLTLRDKNLLKEIYKFTTDEIIPVTFENQKPSIQKIYEYDKTEFSILFVGIANFSPNIEAIDFFIKNVFPFIKAKFIVVGKGMELHRKNYEKINKNIKIVGTVDKVDEYYESADCVVVPIFSGGGMKVKTAEALKYGKTIFGTTEAFEGYEIDYKKIGGLCNTAEEYITEINKYIENYSGKKLNQYSKNIFNEKYSYNSSEKKFKNILLKLNKD